MDSPLINRIAESGIITYNLEDHYPTRLIEQIDLKDYLFQGLILREKDFRAALKEHDWSKYKDKILCVFCSTDAIIPVWAYMLISSLAEPEAHTVFIGRVNEFLKFHYYEELSKLSIKDFQDGRIVIKGCSNKPVPPAAYAFITQLLRPVAKSIMYGEPCSTVPIYKRPLNRVR